jgi:hypothetical protein
MKAMKTTFEDDRLGENEEAWLNLTGGQRLELMMKQRELTRKKGFNYSYKGLKVTVKRGEPLQ